jgi:hypothetical protein
MKRLIVICAVGLILMNAGQAAANITVIDFESLADLEVADNQFLGLGADFNGTASVLRQGSSLSAGFPPNSGANVIFDDPALGSGTVRIDAAGLGWVCDRKYECDFDGVCLRRLRIGNRLDRRRQFRRCRHGITTQHISKCQRREYLLRGIH